MSLFRKAGKKFEETKQQLMSGESADYRCVACEEGLTQEYDECPYCGEDAVEPIA